jgi:hypothetical protein
VPIQRLRLSLLVDSTRASDYVGDIVQFEQEFNDDLCVIAHAVKTYGLPSNLKLSVAAGGHDKFQFTLPFVAPSKTPNAGVHVKTAGTTWLEEVIGLAEAGGEGYCCR